MCHRTRKRQNKGVYLSGRTDVDLTTDTNLVASAEGLRRGQALCAAFAKWLGFAGVGPVFGEHRQSAARGNGFPKSTNWSRVRSIAYFVPSPWQASAISKSRLESVSPDMQVKHAWPAKAEPRTHIGSPHEHVAPALKAARALARLATTSARSSLGFAARCLAM